jgi:hypothetical protein
VRYGIFDAKGHGIPELAERRRRSSKRTAPLEQLTDPHRRPPAVTARD